MKPVDSTSTTTIVWWIMGLIALMFSANMLSSYRQHESITDAVSALREGRTQNAADIVGLSKRIDALERQIIYNTGRLDKLERDFVEIRPNKK